MLLYLPFLFFFFFLIARRSNQTVIKDRGRKMFIRRSVLISVSSTRRWCWTPNEGRTVIRAGNQQESASRLGRMERLLFNKSDM